jgi:hypothetical protein
MVTFMIFSAFADFWLSDFLYLMVGMSIAMTRVWRQQEENSASVEARFAHGREVTSLRFARSER